MRKRSRAISPLPPRSLKGGAEGSAHMASEKDCVPSPSLHLHAPYNCGCGRFPLASNCKYGHRPRAFAEGVLWNWHSDSKYANSPASNQRRKQPTKEVTKEGSRPNKDKDPPPLPPLSPRNRDGAPTKTPPHPHHHHHPPRSARAPRVVCYCLCCMLYVIACVDLAPTRGPSTALWFPWHIA
jgi:hypothetical protein